MSDPAFKRHGFLLRHESPCVLRLTEASRLDFLQRQTTNNLNLLGEDRALPTVLTSPTARILDVFTCVQEGESILLFGQEGRAGTLLAYLRSRIFFMDQVAVADESGAWHCWSLCADQVLPPGASILRLNGGYVYDWGPLDAPRLEIALREGATPQLDGIDLSELDRTAWESLRIARAWPGPAELTEDFTPLEAGLAHMVAENKGCYTGQEVIARQLTYDKVTRGLALLQLDAPASSGAELFSEGRRVGSLSSLSELPGHGLCGLAVVRKPYDQPGSLLDLGQGDSQARVIEPPLP